MWMRVSYGASLVDAVTVRTIHRVPHTAEKRDAVHTLVQRFEESIAGRAYMFEVSAVDPDRFRACIVKAPGVPTALMPFYGTTADAAIAQLRGWLMRAHSCVSAATPAS